LIERAAPLDVNTQKTLNSIKKFHRSKKFKSQPGMAFLVKPEHPLFDGAPSVPKRAIETLKKGAREMGRDPNSIDFTG
jgi:metal-dependent hydrolase (beta-lactamase superfamily II)